MSPRWVSLVSQWVGVLMVAGAAAATLSAWAGLFVVGVAFVVFGVFVERGAG